MPITAARRGPTTRRFRAFAERFIAAQPKSSPMPPKKVEINFLGRFGHERAAVEEGSRAHAIFTQLKKVEQELLATRGRGQPVSPDLVNRRRALLKLLYSELGSKPKT